MRKILILTAILMIVGLVAGQSVGFTETEEIPSEFTGGESFTVNTSFEAEELEGEDVPVVFQLEAYNNEGEKVTREAFDLEIVESDLGTEAAPCNLGDIFSRTLCGYSSVPAGEYSTEFRVNSNVRLKPDQYDLSIDLLSLEGGVDLEDLLLYWNNPVNITRGETTTLSDEDVEVDIRPEEPGENGTEEAWANVEELDEVLQDGPEDKEFIKGAQVLVNQDICEKTVPSTQFLPEEYPEVSCGDDENDDSSGGIDTALVIDRSGSMTPYLIGPAREGAKNYVGNTGEGDRNSVVAFGSGADIIHPLSTEKESVKSSIDNFNAGDSSTDLADGIESGINSLTAEGGGNQYMIVLADGGSNQPLRSVDSRAKAARDAGIEVHGIMYGDSADNQEFNAITNSTCETSLAENDDGDNCWYADTESEDETAGSIYDVLEGVQKDINKDYLKNATEDHIFGGDTGKVDADGSIRFEFDQSEFIPASSTIYRWNNELEGEEPVGWQELDTEIIGGGEVEAEVEEFSTFALFGRKAPPETPITTSSGGSGPFNADVDFSWNAEGLEVEFEDDTNTYNREAESYEWEFGDNSVGEGESLEHVYDESGEYEITLTVTDDQGDEHSESRIIEIESVDSTESQEDEESEEQNQQEGTEGETGSEPGTQGSDNAPAQGLTGQFAETASNPLTVLTGILVTVIIYAVYSGRYELFLEKIRALIS